jgi:hypothetical protein
MLSALLTAHVVRTKFFRSKLGYIPLEFFFSTPFLRKISSLCTITAPLTGDYGPVLRTALKCFNRTALFAEFDGPYERTSSRLLYIFLHRGFAMASYTVFRGELDLQSTVDYYFIDFGLSDGGSNLNDDPK